MSSRFLSGEYSGARLVGIIKEVAPVKGAETDEELGVAEFQEKYFHNFPVYIDQERSFYSFMGNNNLLFQKLHTWNPFQLYSDYKFLKTRLDTKELSGNLAGEGLLKGGLLIISPKLGICYRHEENTGSEMPYKEIGNKLKEIVNLDNPGAEEEEEEEVSGVGGGKRSADEF